MMLETFMEKIFSLFYAAVLFDCIMCVFCTYVHVQTRGNTRRQCMTNSQIRTEI
uniref:Uncharacterized protein n=1 Tax=Anguilla anguilla TaxID=7936 RepID=A0A0E9X1S0_ANGAN